MINAFFITAIGLCFVFFYRRYVKPCEIKFIERNQLNDPQIELLDVRDYRSSFRHPIEGTTNIPFPYLKRYYRNLSKCDICIVASDRIDVNLAARFLKGKGYKVVGYYLTEKNANHPLHVQFNCN